MALQCDTNAEAKGTVDKRGRWRGQAGHLSKRQLAIWIGKVKQIHRDARAWNPREKDTELDGVATLNPHFQFLTFMELSFSPSPRILEHILVSF